MPPKKQQRGKAAGRAAPVKKARVEKGGSNADFTLGGSGWDDDVDSDEVDGKDAGSESSDDDSVDARESAEQKRRRLAKEYLAGLEADASSSSSGGEEEDKGDHMNSSSRGQAISSRLRKERLDAGGRYFRDLSGTALANAQAIQSAPRHVLGGHDLSVTSVALSADETFALSGSKDNSVLRWDVETQQKQVLRAKWRRDTHFEKQASEGEILAVAASSDGRYAVSGGRDNVIRVYDARQANAEVKALSGHRDAVTSLAFRRDSYSLFSGSLDRCLKHWDLSEMGYLETLYGHQDGVTAVDCWAKEEPVSASSDRTIRKWKVVDESHLVFRGHKSSVDSVQLLTEDTFLTGGQEGALHLWKESQKKPILSAHAAHGMESGTNNPNWISSVASVKMSNLAASGSNDGYVRLWSASAEARQLKQVAAVAAEGFVNSIAMSPRLMVLGMGREHRWGRWWCTPGNKNKVVIMRFPSDLEVQEEGDESEGSEEGSSEEEEEGSEEEEKEGSEEEEESD